MPLTHNGYRLSDVALAIAEVIKSAYGGQNVEIVPRWTVEYLNDAETPDASLDELSFEIDRWDILAKGEGVQRKSEPVVCNGKLTIQRQKQEVFILKFRYSVGRDENEKDELGKYSYDRFLERIDSVGDELSATPHLIPKEGGKAAAALHGELQVDNIGIVGFRREWCFEMTGRLTVNVWDSVTKE